MLKWAVESETLKSIYKQITNYQQQKVNDMDLYKNLFFEIHLKEKVLNISKLIQEKGIYSKMKHLEKKLMTKPFRTIAAYKIIKSNKPNNNNNIQKRSYRDQNSNSNSYLYHRNRLDYFKPLFRHKKDVLNQQSIVLFEYNLTNLIPNTKYTFEISSRIINLESYLSKPLSLYTLRKLITILIIFFLAASK